MRYFFRAFLIFLYLCLVTFIKPAEVFAYNSYVLNNIPLNYITEAKSKVTETEAPEHYYAIIQNNNNAQITNNNNKNSDFSAVFGNECLITDNALKYSVFDKNKLFFDFFKNRQVKNLKYTIYPGAP